MNEGDRDGVGHPDRPADPSTDARHAAPEAREYARPDGVDGGFAPRPPSPVYNPPPPTVSPADQAVFGRPAPDAAFAPAPGERIAPRLSYNPPVPKFFSDSFGATPQAQGGFDPEPGTRIRPAGPPAESPWWKSDAPRDPWRDPSSPFWLGRGAVFSGGAPAQVEPDQDSETALDDEPLDETGDEDLEPPDNVRRGRFGLPTLALTLVIALVAGLIGGGVGWYLTEHVTDALHRPDVSIAQVKTPTSRPATSVAGIAKRVGPAVVSIAVKTPDEFAIGSGVVIDSDGDVLTNNHVISGAVGVKGASIVVTFSNEATAAATIVGRDSVSDLAVIKVTNDQLTVAQLGNSSDVAVGDPVIAIGSPLGLQGTVTSGIVSALDRPVHVYSDDGSSDAYLDAIQTDAPINPGNSGGALVNSSGAVIGINSAAALGSTGPSGSQSATTGIGYAIPINAAREVALQLIHTGKAVHGSFGAQGKTALAGVQVGGYIVQISPGGPAAKAGLHQGDVIVAADGKVIHTFDEIIVIAQAHNPGDRIQVTYYRKNSADKVTTTVTLG
ncbi:MAG TPA: trypsin-like peptidase domain-containing protein [Jatrophihabitans sp.]|uniref:trypsin-like peptidase domain-containing protein n=1 Tax=Jatrophihabitans sp. TaxID=1932789 RepID=UPI002E06BE0E|nr:trypsin-like peptidase domain-containing protein [Jatrophihabitans sp.]